MRTVEGRRNSQILVRVDLGDAREVLQGGNATERLWSGDSCVRANLVVDQTASLVDDEQRVHNVGGLDLGHRRSAAAEDCVM
jgi:hypothetical protein